MVRDSLCELQIKDGQTIFLAKLAYEPHRFKIYDGTLPSCI
ncbi:Hok/Gef family protein [Photobacterium damselae]|nr:Hok/Gef family protein [Photobacterium damselae]